MPHKARPGVTFREAVAGRSDGAAASPSVRDAFPLRIPAFFTADKFFRKPSKGIFKADDKSRDRVMYRPLLQLFCNGKADTQIIDISFKLFFSRMSLHHLFLNYSFFSKKISLHFLLKGFPGRPIGGQAVTKRRPQDTDEGNEGINMSPLRSRPAKATESINVLPHAAGELLAFMGN